MGVFFGVNINLLSMYGNATTYDVLASSLYFGAPWAFYKAQAFGKQESIKSGLAAYVGAITGHTLAQLMVSVMSQ